MEDCMIIRGWVHEMDGRERAFRPASPAPSLHWAYILMDNYNHLVNFAIKWIDNEPMITITKEASKEADYAFRHIMEFANLHNLEITWCKRKCDDCDGHEACLSEDSKK